MQENTKYYPLLPNWLIFIVVVLFFIWTFFKLNNSDTYDLKIAQDSIALFKHHQQALLHEIEKSEVREQSWKDSVRVLLDSVKVLNKKDSVLHHKLKSIKPKEYNSHQLNTMWEKRYANQVSPIPTARDIEFPIKLSTGSFLQSDLEKLDVSNEIIKNDSSRIEYLQGIVNEQDSVAQEKDKQIQDYKKIVKLTDKTDSARVEENQILKKEIVRQKKGKVIAIAAGTLAILISLFAR